LPLRFAVTGAVVIGPLGAVVGLTVGLRTYPPTAWAAMVEVGLPAAALSGAVGAVVGALAQGADRARRRGPSPR